MNRLGKALIIVAVAAFGLWGCTQASNGPSGQSERIRALESKCTKLEDDYKNVSKDLKEANNRVAALKDENAQLEEKRKKGEEELKQLTQQLDARTSEGKALQARCERMKKGLQELIGQDDALAAPPAVPSGGGQ
jgi:septal ring factor EnvC (AmiA/AmiB activator)